MILALIAACLLDVDTGNAFHTAILPDAAVALTLGNGSPSNETFRGRLTVRDFFGHGCDIPVDVQVPVGGTVRLPVPAASCRRKGIYRVAGALTDAAGVSTNVATSFAVIAPHPVTSVDRSGRFLPGVNCHLSWWKPEARAVCYDVMNAIGAKLVRCGGMTSFSRTCAKGPEPDFSDTAAVYGELTRRGLAINANVHGTPVWALQPEKRKLKRAVNHRTKPVDGAVRAYAEKLARRFGTDIAYYEVGNELDLLSSEQMTIEEAIAFQREAYAGVKAGCPTAQVATCGFAFPDSDKKRVLQKGMQERIVSEAKDAYDFHAIHLHGTFDGYVESMRRFFAMRERLGVTDKPWYQNECALTSTNGREDEAAATVWRKMLYSWSHGSPGFVWYNLRAKGTDPNDHEHGYGIVTWDFHPRAAAAAFAGFTEVFAGADRDAVLIERERRYAFRFRRSRDVLVAGWDMNLTTSAVVRVRTDARRAFVSDLMGNRTELAVKDGTVGAAFALLPQAWIFEEATFAEPLTNELAAAARPADAIVVTRDRPVEFRLDRASDMHEIYEADPIYEHRCWRGPDDLSVRIVLSQEKTGRVLVTAYVRDEREAPEDGVACVWGVDGCRRTRPLKRLRRAGDETVYAASFSPVVTKFPFRVLVHDGDGEGEDGWATLGPLTVVAPR